MESCACTGAWHSGSPACFVVAVSVPERSVEEQVDRFLAAVSKSLVSFVHSPAVSGDAQISTGTPGQWNRK